MADIRLGLDVGTTAIKAAGFAADGTRVALVERATALTRTAGGGVEQEMAAVWATVAECLRALMAECAAHVPVSLGICAQGDGLWCVDEAGAPVRAAMLWNDTRAARDVDRLTENGAAAVLARGCHTSLWPGTSGALWRWLRQAEPENAARTAHVMTCADWIGLRLTGMAATDFANASIPFLDFGARGYAAKGLAALDCDDLGARLLPPRRADSALGDVNAAAATETGLPMGLPVSVGTLDLGAMIVGMGMDRPGQTMMIMGTTAVVNMLTDRVEPSDTPAGASVLHPTADLTIRVLAPTTGAAAFDWFARLHPATLGGDSAGEVAEKINALVQEVPVGANGVTFLPYLGGERAPFVASDIRGALQGLSASTTKAEMGRAVMEGAALSLRHCFMSEGGLPTAPVQLTGGGSKNPVWCQIIADIVGQPVLVSAASDQGLWGVACLGAAAAGMGDAVKLAARDEPMTRYTPDPAAHAAYAAVFARYMVLSDGQRRMHRDLGALEHTEKATI